VVFSVLSGEMFTGLSGHHDFSGDELQLTRFVDCKRWDPLFLGTDLRWACFVNCRMDNVHLLCADVRGAVFIDCRMPHEVIRELHGMGARFFLSKESIFKRMKDWLM